MRLLKLDPAAGYKKCARVVGDVIGKYHPHGDQSVYDAMVRLAQTFSLRYPLVDGQGNFGNVDGDNAAAMRYTEARLTQAAHDLMAGLDEGTVDFRPDLQWRGGRARGFPRPVPQPARQRRQRHRGRHGDVDPAAQLAEIVDAAVHLIDNPAAEPSALMDFVSGPDFPTGGIIVDSAESIALAYRTGRGGFRVRARWSVEDQGRGTWNAIISEIPYQVPKSKLIEQIAGLIGDKKLRSSPTSAMSRMRRSASCLNRAAAPSSRRC
jgi:topoisomerase-4 subunit A